MISTDSIPIILLIIIITNYFLRRQFQLFKQATQPMPSEIINNDVTTDDYQPSRRDIYHTSFLLRQKLPPELIPDIMDYAEYWLRSIDETDLTVEVSDSGTFHGWNPGDVYLSSHPIGVCEEVNELRWVGLHPVRKVLVTVTSGDQGWSSYPNDHGTERNSSSWFEVVVREGVQDSGTTGEELEDGDGREGEVERPRGKTIITNVHAGRDWRTKTVTWSVYSDNDEEREWVKDLRRGQFIDLRIWAKYLGWRNRAKYGRIDVYFAAVR